MTGPERYESGKLPPAALTTLLARYVGADPALLVRPGVGVDAAVLDLDGTLLVAKSDPITFATREIGRYAVHVNANDVACMGATPRWFLATLLLPPGIDYPAIERIYHQIHESCSALGATLVGGHTEVTLGLDRPIVAGTMLGTVTRELLVTPDRAREGDVVVIARGFPIEGGAIIAHEWAGTLIEKGWTDGAIAMGRELLHEPGISVVESVRVAQSAAAIHALHDPTEGGIATGLHELATATGLGVEVEAEALPYHELAARLCAAAGLDPLGTIASGALIIVVPPNDLTPLLAALHEAEIPASAAGRLLSPDAGRWLLRDGAREPLPEFAVDEIVRLF